MNLAQWTAMDDYITSALLPHDAILDAALAACQAAGLPEIQVSRAQGAFLTILAHGADRILEIGALGGFSAICLARALGPGGRLITLEIDPAHAKVARENIARAGFAGQAEVRIGPALDGLAQLEAENAGPFDFIFIDADKAPYAEYFTAALRLARPGTLIVADNVVRDGKVGDPANPDPAIQGIRRFNERVAATPNVIATALQTVGAKGYDGFAIIMAAGAE